MKQKISKTSRYIVIGVLLFFLYSCGSRRFLKDLPNLSQYDTIRPTVTKVNDSLFVSNSDYLVKNKYNQWELYIHGDPLHRGLVAGALMDSLLYFQAQAFFQIIQEFIPSKAKQKRILSIVKLFNRNIFKYIPQEYKVELYSLSRYLSDTFNYLAPPYQRALYLHAAHDIGHALVNYSLVNECTSMALWGKQSPTGNLIVGRNLDFYVGKKFAQNQLIIFNRPKGGIPYVAVAWPGMMGVLSGMNKAGLTVTMNAGPSKIPFAVKEPISLVARDILEHASTIKEAIKIAKNSQVFVSEALMVTSAKDNRAVSIEMTPNNFGVYETYNGRLVCTNHFQSKAYKNDKKNQERIKNGHSMYRYKRANQLLDSIDSLTPKKMAFILRNKKGLNGVSLGYGNEKAINQLLCHHAVIFEPAKRKIWISSHPYNEGAFTCYDLDAVFSSHRKINYKPQYIDSLTISPDPFLSTQAFKDYEKYREISQKIDAAIQNKEITYDLSKLPAYRKLNPQMWEVYYKSGILYYHAKEYKKAKNQFEMALQKVITTIPDKNQVKKMLKKTKRKLR